MELVFLTNLVRSNGQGPGFSLMEIVVILSVVSLFMIVTIPSYIIHQRNCRASAVANCFRTYATAFRNYSIEEQAWPQNTQPGKIPAGMEQQLPLFDQESVLGGKWDWEPHTEDCDASICLIHPAPSESVISKIDTILDDGNLNTGDLVLRENRVTFYLSD